jgi:hypothetical protein
VDDLKSQIKDLDSDLRQRDGKLTDLEDTLRQKDGEIQDLEDMINSKDNLIKQLEHELLDMDERRRREEEERRQRELDAMKKPEPRKWYIPLKGDAIDEMMAKYLNECDFYVPVKRLGEGQYMYGSKKIFAKIMNGRLIIRVGGGYMLIDEFLKNYAEVEREKSGAKGVIDDGEEHDSPVRSKIILCLYYYFREWRKSKQKQQITQWEKVINIKLT